MTALATRDLGVAYQGTPALQGVNLNMPAGVMGAIVGPNGAGKSTLVKAVLGLITPGRGEALLFGESVAKARHRVGYVPQRSAIDWDFPATALDVVVMGLYRRLGLFGRPGRAERERALAALFETGMAAFAARQIGQLSGGQQQRVFLARALAQDADLYLLDEPLAGVDAVSEEALVRVLMRLRDEGKTVLAVHHDLSTLGDYFEWLALLNVQLIAQGPLTETYTLENLQRAYGGHLPRPPVGMVDPGRPPRGADKTSAAAKGSTTAAG